MKHLKFFGLGLLIIKSSMLFSQSSYLRGDFHQHTTYSDGSYSIGHMMSKNNQFGLDWWANSEHGGGFTANARVSGLELGTTVYWDSYTPNPIVGTVSFSGGHQKMWRWQSLDSSFTQVLKARNDFPSKTIIQSFEWNVPGHEHCSMGLINNQFQATPDCTPLRQFEFMFDNSDADLTGGVAQGWTKSTNSGHAKALEAISWLQSNYPTTSYAVLAHPERKPQASGGYTIASLRDMNNAGSDVCFGFESMPGHQKEAGRGGYSASSVGGGTYGGCGYFSAIVGGVWDALLSEGRRFWLFANSDSHNEEGDFYPGEYQKNYTYTTGKSAQNIVDGLRSGNNWIVNGDLIDSLIYNIETVDQARTKAVMGSILMINKGQSVKITIKARDPQSNNYNTYSSYTNPVLDHIDIIKGKVTGIIDPSSPDYTVDTVNTTSVIARFDAVGGVTDTKGITSKPWKSLGNGWVEMSLIVKNVTDSVYFRLRGTNLGLNVANETDADGNPLLDALMGTNNAAKAFADLWFYSNPIFVYSTPIKKSKFQIKQASDDLEERIVPLAGQTQTKTVGSVDWTSSDLELGCESSATKNPQMVGLRFADINIEKNKVIKKAYIEFEVDEPTAEDPCVLNIYSEDNDNPSTFTNTNNALTSRPKSADFVTWAVPSGYLNIEDEKGNSAEITSLVQANLNRAGWAKGNAMAFYITGTGRRVVESYDGEASAAAALVIEYEMNEQDIKDMQVADSIAYNLALKADSILSVTLSLNETNYTIPSWTKYLMAQKAVSNNPTETAVNNLETAMNNLVPFEKPFAISMTFNGEPSSRMGFTWYTNAGVTGGKIQIIEGIVLDQSAFSTPLFSIDATCMALDNVNYNVSSNNLSTLAGIANNSKRSYVSNKVLVTGLTPNTTYSYRVGKDGAWSEIGTFTTAKNTNDNFSFVYITDTQANTVENFEISEKTTHAAQKMFPNANFWLQCGDLIETSGSTNSEWEWEQFFQTNQDIFMKKPLVAVVGNHDNSANKNFTNHFNTKSEGFDSTMSTTPGSVYSFVYGDALFMAINSENYNTPKYLDSLKTWMREQVAANPNTKWRIAFYHKTVYTGSQSHQSDADGKIWREAMAPLFDSLKIDLALQGHDHIYEVIGPVNNKTKIDAVTSQSTVPVHARENLTGKLNGIFDVKEGTLYFLNNSAGKKKYEPCSEAQMQAVEAGLGITNYFGLFTGRFGQDGLPTFSNVSVSTDTIKITTYSVNDAGETALFDEFMIVKNDIVNWQNPADIVYNTPLGNDQLNATTSANGTLIYEPAAGTILNAGNAQPLKVKIQSEKVNYSNYSKVVYINVSKANPQVFWGNPADITFNTLLSSTQLNATANIDGTYTYEPALGTKLNAGDAQALKVTFTPVNSNYVSAEKQVFINVLKAKPELSWTNPADITYNTLLSSTQLNATADIDGAYTYEPVSGTKLNAGNAQVLKVTFVPKDSNYVSVDKQVTINVLKANPLITWANPADITAGTALGSKQLNAVANVNGTFEYSPAAGTILTVGNGKVLSAEFLPADSVNYNKITAKVEINVLASTGIAASNNSKASVFPNPASDFLVVKSDNAIRKVSIINLLGENLVSVSGETCNQPIKIQHLPANVYLVKITLSNNETITAKIVKK
jgi:flavodoxin